MELENNIIHAMHELFFRAKDIYGDRVESFWFYESEFCPCCNKKIDLVNAGKELSLLSLNSFMYHNMSVLIIFSLQPMYYRLACFHRQEAENPL